MLKLYLTLQNLWADKRGVTAIEYAVLAGAVAVALAASHWHRGSTISTRHHGCVPSPDPDRQ